MAHRFNLLDTHTPRIMRFKIGSMRITTGPSCVKCGGSLAAFDLTVSNRRDFEASTVITCADEMDPPLEPGEFTWMVTEAPATHPLAGPVLITARRRDS